MARKSNYERQLAVKTDKALASLPAGAIDVKKLQAALDGQGLALIDKDTLAYYQRCAQTMSCL